VSVALAGTVERWFETISYACVCWEGAAQVLHWLWRPNLAVQLLLIPQATLHQENDSFLLVQVCPVELLPAQRWQSEVGPKVTYTSDELGQTGEQRIKSHKKLKILPTNIFNWATLKTSNFNFLTKHTEQSLQTGNLCKLNTSSQGLFHALKGLCRSQTIP